MTNSTEKKPDDTRATVSALTGYQDVIIRAAQDRDFDIERLARLIELQEAQETRVADRAFNEAMSAAQGEMRSVLTDADNPQTRSRYAKYATLDRAIRPIYTKYGFSVSYNTEPSGDPNLIRVIGLVANGPIMRRHQVDMPIVTQGIRGTDTMTRVHATSSALTYGKRNLLTMIFNLSTADDDGNRAAGYAPQRQQPPLQRPAVKPPIDPKTGEVTPHQIDANDKDTGEEKSWQQWGSEMIAAVRSAQSETELDAWLECNRVHLSNFKLQAPNVFAHLDNAIRKHREQVQKPDGQRAAKDTSQ